MLTEQKLDAVRELAQDLKRRRAQEPAPPPDTAAGEDPPLADDAWARENLRWGDGRPFMDLANVVRILDRHEDYNRRFSYNDALAKVMDKGAVMLEWRVGDVCADIQERFLPEVPEATVAKALLIQANRVSARK